MIPTPKLTPEQEDRYRANLEFAKRIGSHIGSRFTDAGGEDDPKAKPANMEGLLADLEALNKKYGITVDAAQKAAEGSEGPRE